jgi:hypothetical protein
VGPQLRPWVRDWTTTPDSRIPLILLTVAVVVHMIASLRDGWMNPRVGVITVTALLLPRITHHDLTCGVSVVVVVRAERQRHKCLAED